MADFLLVSSQGGDHSTAIWRRSVARASSAGQQVCRLPTTSYLDGVVADVDIKAPSTQAVCDAFHLGRAMRPLEPVPGGLSHRMWRLTSARGVFAIKQLNRDWGNPDYTEWYERAFGVEMAAVDAGVPMPRPIRAYETGRCLAELPGPDDEPITVRAHEWVDAKALGNRAYNGETVAEVGATLARIHLLDLRSDTSPEAILRIHGEEHWLHLTQRIEDARCLWASQLRGCLPTIADLEAFVVASRAELGTPLLSHRDASPKNFLVSPGGRLFLIDWDAAGPVSPRQEVAKVCLDWARADLGMPERLLARAVLAGYRRAGGDLPAPQPSDFGEFLCTTLGWLEFNVRRTLGERLQDTSLRSFAEREAQQVLGNLRRFSQSIESWVHMLT